MSKDPASAIQLRKFGMRDKLAYAAGDFGCNMSFCLKSYMMIYWTQYMKLDSYIYASLLLICQVWDAINDPVIGAMIDADRHKYKRNKFLQYIWVGSIGLIVAGALCFLPFPNMGGTIKGILFVVGYVFWDAFYTVANVPYGSMLPIITEDTVERAQLSSFRSGGATLAGLATGLLMPMIIYDASNNLRGEQLWILALVMGILGFIAFQFMIRNTTIRVDTELRAGEDAPKFNFFAAMKNFVRNRAVLGTTLAACSMFLSMYGASAASTVMFQAYFKNARISGIMSFVNMIPTFLWMAFVPKLVRRFGKKEAAAAGGLFSVASCVLMCVLPIGPNMTGLAIYMVCQFFNGLGLGIGNVLSYSMTGDAIDYNELKFGVRDEGTTYAIHSFFRKLAQGVGPSLGLVVATALGYVAAQGPNQTPEVALTMRYVVAVYYLLGAILYLVSYGLIFNLDKKTVEKMKTELEARHAK